MGWKGAFVTLVLLCDEASANFRFRLVFFARILFLNFLFSENNSLELI
jgi:hypothetical protein